MLQRAFLHCLAAFSRHGIMLIHHRTPQRCPNIIARISERLSAARGRGERTNSHAPYWVALPNAALIKMLRSMLLHRILINELSRQAAFNGRTSSVPVLRRQSPRRMLMLSPMRT